MATADSLKKLQAMIKGTTSSIPQLQEKAIETGDFNELRRAQQTVKMLSGLADKAIANPVDQEPPAPTPTPPEPQEGGAKPPGIQSIAPPPVTFDQSKIQYSGVPKPVETPLPVEPPPVNDFMVKKANASKSVIDAVDDYLASLGPSRRGSFKDDAPFVKDDDGSIVPVRVKIIKNPDKAAFILSEAKMVEPRDMNSPFYRKIENAVRAYSDFMRTPEGVGGEMDVQGSLALRDSRLRQQKQAGLESLLAKETAGREEVLAQRPVSPREQDIQAQEAARRGQVIGGITEQQAHLDRFKPKPAEPGVAALLGATPAPGDQPLGLPEQEPSLGTDETIKQPVMEMAAKAQEMGTTPQSVIAGLQQMAGSIQEPGLDLEKEFIRRMALLAPREIPTWERLLTALAYGASNIFSRWVSRNWRMPLNFPDLFANDRRTDEMRRQIAMQLISERAADRRQQTSLNARSLSEKARSAKSTADATLAQLNAKIRVLDARNTAEGQNYKIKAEPIRDEMDGMMKIMNDSRDPMTGALDEGKYNAAFQRYQDLLLELKALAASTDIQRPVIK